jgi:hypothetical protein
VASGCGSNEAYQMKKIVFALAAVMSLLPAHRAAGQT